MPNKITYIIYFCLINLLIISNFLAQRFGQNTDNHQIKNTEMVTIQFPHATVDELLLLYEQLTKKNIIRDSNLNGPQLSIMAANPLPKSDAIALIENSLLLNGYIFVPVDSETIKILGPSHSPRMEGIPLYYDISSIRKKGDEVISLYYHLKYISSDEALHLLKGFVQLDSYGMISPIPELNGLIITEKTSMIRKIVGFLSIADQEETEFITEFISLKRANLDKTVDILNQIFNSENVKNHGNENISPLLLSNDGSHFIADKRTNRLLIIVRKEKYAKIKKLIAELDKPTESEKPLVRHINYLSVSDLFPLLVDMLRGNDDPEKGKRATTSPSNTPNFTKNSSTNSGFINQNNSENQGNNLSVPNTPDKLSEVMQNNPPQSITIGYTTIIADENANSIIVYGSVESKSKMDQIIQLLDQRPKQVYLAAVIGQLRLNNDLDYGANWLANLNNGALKPAAIEPGVFNSLSSFVNNGLSAAIPATIGGLTVYGAVFKAVSTYANFLETTGRFHVLARPVIYASNNQKATIFSGENIPIPVSTLTSVTPGITPGSSSIQSNIQYQPVVLKLEVIPLINSDKEIKLVIAQRNDRLGTNTIISGNNIPSILTQELTTTVRVPSGATIVLGGLITDDQTNTLSGIPYVDKIPVLGPLIGGRKRKVVNRNELIIMIQPIVVDNNNSSISTSLKEGGMSNLGIDAEHFSEKFQSEQVKKNGKKHHFLINN